MSSIYIHSAIQNVLSNILSCSLLSPKLFDFGLVKELKPSSRVTSVSCNGRCDDCDEDAVVYKLTGRTGSRRYMSPEVAFSQPYNYKADIYSFGILLYEMATLIQPFVGYTIHRHEVEVLRKGYRPCTAGYDNYWPDGLTSLIEDCWAGDMKCRPKIDEVIQRLDGCIDELNTTPMVTRNDSMGAARTILTSISQLHLTSSQKESPVPSARSNTDDGQCKGKSKIRQILSSIPTPLNAVLSNNREDSTSLSLRKRTAPQA